MAGRRDAVVAAQQQRNGSMPRLLNQSSWSGYCDCAVLLIRFGCASLLLAALCCSLPFKIVIAALHLRPTTAGRRRQEPAQEAGDPRLHHLLWCAAWHRYRNCCQRLPGALGQPHTIAQPLLLQTFAAFYSWAGAYAQPCYGLQIAGHFLPQYWCCRVLCCCHNSSHEESVKVVSTRHRHP